MADQPLILNAEHRQFLAAHASSLLEFAAKFPAPVGGAGWLTNTGELDLERPVHTWITSRMAHAFGIGHQMGVPGAGALAQQALDGLRGPLHDAANGGWYASIPATLGSETDANGAPIGADTTKAAYAHAFVILAASTGVRAGLHGAQELLTDALDVFDRHFFDPKYGLHADEFNADWSELSDYRGVNANMHAVEALLAAGDVTGDAKWHDRALEIARTVALSWAAKYSWRIPEHFDEQWTPLLDLNRETPDDPFKPFGATVGHGIEWARLLLHLDATLGSGNHPWLVDSAARLYDRAVADGWRLSDQGAWGFVYTTDWQGQPVVETRMHWVAAEALAAAATLFHATGQTRYADDYERWFDHISQFLIDTELGSWHHELNAANEPTAKVWPGKPDIYHAFQAVLYPLVPLAPSLGTSAKDIKF